MLNKKKEMDDKAIDQVLCQVLDCCQEIQRLIEHFGDNPTIFIQTHEYVCAVIGQCMFLRDLVRFSLPNEWRQYHQGFIWNRTLRVCNACAHPIRKKLDLNHLWFFIKIDVLTLSTYCQEFLTQKEQERMRGG